jgi:DNA-binding FrmR family transcriptional regulator
VVYRIVRYENERSLLAALRRIEGQARGIQRMVEAERPCAEVVQQLAALRGAADRLSHRIVAQNLRACLADMDLSDEQRTRVEQGLTVVADLRS